MIQSLICPLVVLLGSAATDELAKTVSLSPTAVAHLEPAVAAQLRDVADRLEPIVADDTVPEATRSAAYGELARLYHAYGLTEVAAAAYRRAQSLDPSTFRWSYGLAFLLEEAGELAAAAASYQRAIELDPGSLEAWIHLGDVYLELNLVDRAEQAYSRSLTLEPKSPAAHAGLGQVALSRRDFGSAVERLELVLSMVPTATRLHHPLGLAYRGLGDPDAAREHLRLRGQIGVRPAEPLLDELENLRTGSRVHSLQGRMAFGAGDFAAAAAAFERAVQADPASAEGRINLASALNELGHSREAIAHLSRALELDPDNATAHFNLGQLALSSGDLESAVAHTRAALRSNASDGAARLALARALAGLGRPAEALAEARAAIDSNPSEGEARLVEAEILTGLGRFREAAERLLEASARMPEDGQIAFGLARLLAASPEPEVRDGARAYDLATRVFEARPTTAHAEVVAEALAELGLCEEASEWQRQVVESSERAGSQFLPQHRRTLEHYLESRPCRPPLD